MPLTIGQTVHATVEKAVDYGVYLRTPEGDCLLVLITDLGGQPGQHPSTVYPVGTRVSVEVLLHNPKGDVYRAVNPRRVSRFERSTMAGRSRFRIAIQTGTTAFFAEVEVARQHDETQQNDPDERVGRSPWPRSWAAAADEGVSWGLRLMASDERVVVTDLVGLITDTNTVLVALAAAQAVWQLLDVGPREDVVQAIDEAVRGSWQHEPEGSPEKVLEELASRLGGSARHTTSG